jgi:hypothetical protein
VVARTIFGKQLSDEQQTLLAELTNLCTKTDHIDTPGNGRRMFLIFNQPWQV